MCREDVMDPCTLQDCLRGASAWISRKIHCLLSFLSLKGELQGFLTPFKRKELQLALFPFL